MSESLFSPSWYRVAELTPRIRRHAQIHRHEYRDQIWFVLQDHAAGRSHRFTPAAHHFIGLMDGERTVQELWDITNTNLGDDAPTQEEVIRLLGQLHAADVLQCNVPSDSLELFRRYQRNERQQWKRRLMTPLAMRFPIFDPDRFLDRWLPLVRPLIGWAGFSIWLLVVAGGLVLAAMHWSELTENVIDQALAPQNLLVLFLIYPVVKAIHELGHGFVAKSWGGEIHEMGIMLLVLVPVPYVDASSSTAFPEKHRRMAVGAAGICVELFLSAIALVVWLNVEPGTLHTVAYNVMLIGGVSTIFFNGNPLLRFDGYYVLADWAEIPNLGTRSNKFFGYLFQRYLFGVRDAETPVTSRGERGWFVCYGLAAFMYRMFIMFVIIIFIAGKFFFVGVVLALWALATQILGPLGKVIKPLATKVRSKRKGVRTVSVSSLLAASVVALLFFLPAPLWTRAEGVCWPPERSQVRAGTDGFIARVLVDAETLVRAGQPLIEAEDPFLPARVLVLEAHLRELASRLAAELVNDRVAAAIVREEIHAVNADLDRAQDRAADLTIRSPVDGIFMVSNIDDLPGRYVRQGELVAYVVNPPELTARVVVPQSDIGMVRARTRGVAVMLAEWGADAYPSRILREVPAGTNRLPTAALGPVGGGPIPVDPRDSEGMTTIGRVFHFELELPQVADAAFLGSRVFVRFDHGFEPVGFRLYRALRRLLLSQFGI